MYDDEIIRLENPGVIVLLVGFALGFCAGAVAGYIIKWLMG